MWHRVAPLLARRHRVFAVDLPPFGCSQRRSPYTLARWTVLVQGFARRLGLDRPVLVGHSLGAAVAVSIAAEHPRATSGIVLLDGDARTTTGRPLDGGNLVRREFKTALRRAGLRQIRFHDLRHTFASLLIAQGERVKYISQQLGHASAQMTLDRYGHLMPEAFDLAGDRLDAALFGASVPALASTGLSGGAAGFRSDDEEAPAIPLVPAVSRQEAALASGL